MQDINSEPNQKAIGISVFMRVQLTALVLLLRPDTIQYVATITQNKRA